MKINKPLKIEGTIIITFFVLILIGLIMTYFFDAHGFIVILTSPYLLLIALFLLSDWIYRLRKHQKTT